LIIYFIYYLSTRIS